MKYRLPLVLLVALAVVLSSVGPVVGQTADPTLAARPPDDLTDPPPLFTFEQYPPSVNDNLVLQWDEELLQAIRALPPGPTVVARAISVVHTAIFDAWAAYDARALGTRLRGSLRRPAAERTLANKNKAISFAAYKTLVDLFPARQFDFAEQMSYLGYAVDGSDTSTPATVGITAAQAVIDYRHGDGSNQLNGYADTTGYKPVNTGDVVVDPWRWQPLRVPLGSGPQQLATTPQWSTVKGFALKSPNQFTTPGPDRLQSGFDPKHIDNLLALTSNLTDRQKVTAEYWADGPRSEFPPGHWALIAQVLSRKRGHSLDTDVKLFFALGNALMDASIAAWAAKYKWDFVRPITAIRSRYKGKQVTSWLGPYQGYGQVPGERWIPYQAPNVVTPPFPEYVSGHSTFSSAAAAILASFTGSDSFGASVTIEAGTSLFEPRTGTQVGTPATDILLSWPTLTAAAKDAGLSRRLGGIHFQDGDEHGYNLGQRVGNNVLGQTMGYVNGTIGP
ncbi:MAG TPA: vanadium-dependent haloperoxidase [Actinomycetes bacterium]|nr:vanadium-dependent haloperoxidase [Actinomycetes bacterium]